MTSRAMVVFASVTLASCCKTTADVTHRERDPAASADRGTRRSDSSPGDAAATPAQIAGCSAHSTPRPIPTLTASILHASRLRQVLEDAKHGKIVRVRVKAHNPRVMCDWPNFSVDNYAAETTGLTEAIDGGGMFYAIFPKPLIDANKYKALSVYGDAKYELVGYYSGRLIDASGWSRAQYGKAPQEACENRDLSETQYPEFCVEEWCMSVSPARDGWDDEKQRKDDEKEYEKLLRDVRGAGVPTCPVRDAGEPPR